MSASNSNTFRKVFRGFWIGLSVGNGVVAKRALVLSLMTVGTLSVLVACVGVNNTDRHWEDFSPLLSKEDIQEIKLLVATRRDILQPVWKISTDEARRDHATVTSGKWINPGDESDSFQVEKRNGRWRIISRIDRGRLKAEDILKIS